MSAIGERQAEATAEWLYSRYTISKVASSPLRRAVETAEPIVGRLGLRLMTDARLRERVNWAKDQSLEEFLSDWDRSSAERTFVPRSGDSSHQAADRFLAALRDLATDPEGVVVAVAHGGVTVDALRTLLGDADLRARSPRLIEEGVPSCAITIFRRTDLGWTVELPSAEHLASRA